MSLPHLSIFESLLKEKFIEKLKHCNQIGEDNLLNSTPSFILKEFLIMSLVLIDINKTVMLNVKIVIFSKLVSHFLHMHLCPENSWMTLF
jgi:hypothetical protein